MESLVKERQRPTLRLLVCVVLADECLDLLGEEAADRRVALRGEDLGFSQRSTIESDGNVLGSGLGCGHGNLCTYYTCCTWRAGCVTCKVSVLHRERAGASGASGEDVVLRLLLRPQ